jgi:regulator of RNase E activity RraA
VLAGAGTDVDHVVGDPDGVLVVLDDEHRVAEVAQAHERVDEARLSRWCRPIDGSSST